MSFIYKNVRRAVIKDLAESGYPLLYLAKLKQVIEDIEDEQLTDDEIREEAWPEEPVSFSVDD